jgi:hypothetical protein
VNNNSQLIGTALVEFVRLDLAAWRGFGNLRRAVMGQRVRSHRAPAPSEVDRVVSAVWRACALYVRPARCLLRSAAVTRMLRRRGINASLVIGCQHVPLRAHAWVEVEGRVVSDDIRDRLQFYQVVDRW